MINLKANPWWIRLHKKLFAKAGVVQPVTRQELTFSGRPRAIQIPASVVDAVLSRHEVHEWFSYVFHHRASRWDVWTACDWIAEQFPPTAEILETGCGVGFNLQWLADCGFENLAGFDIDASAISAGQELCRLCNRSIDLWGDDGLNPSLRALKECDVVVALNWTMLIDSFDLDGFVRIFSKPIRRHGALVIDIIDSSYNEMKNNEFHTSDLEKSEDARRPTEYRSRFSFAQIEHAGQAAGMRVEQVISQAQSVPKNVYVLRKEFS